MPVIEISSLFAMPRMTANTLLAKPGIRLDLPAANNEENRHGYEVAYRRGNRGHLAGDRNPGFRASFLCRIRHGQEGHGRRDRQGIPMDKPPQLDARHGAEREGGAGAMGGRAQLGESVGGARLETENGSAGRQGCHHVSSDEERNARRQLYGDQAAQWQNHGQCRPARYRGGMMRRHRLAKLPASSALLIALAVAPVSVAGAPSNAPGAQAWPDFSGIYWTNSYSPKIQPLGGGN